MTEGESMTDKKPLPCPCGKIKAPTNRERTSFSAETYMLVDGDQEWHPGCAIAEIEHLRREMYHLRDQHAVLAAEAADRDYLARALMTKAKSLGLVEHVSCANWFEQVLCWMEEKCIRLDEAKAQAADMRLRCEAALCSLTEGMDLAAEGLCKSGPLVENAVKELLAAVAPEAGRRLLREMSALGKVEEHARRALVWQDDPDHHLLPWRLLIEAVKNLDKVRAEEKP